MELEYYINLYFPIVSLIIIIVSFVIFFEFVKVTFQGIKRALTNNYFKNNIIYSENNTKYKNNYVDVKKDKLARFNTDDINGLKDYFYDLFYKFEVAYNNLDYSTMKMLSTKQLYQNYYTGISLNLKIGKKKVIDQINKKRVILYELDSTSMKQIASLMIEISYFTYTLDKHGYIISGNRDYPITEKFQVEFRKDFERKAITHCPNCGASLHGNKCDYCKSKVKEVEFKISSIKKIVD